MSEEKENKESENTEKKKAVLDKLSAEASPTVMEIKKAKARRLNNRPMKIGAGVAMFLILIFGVVMVGRANKVRAEVSRTAQTGRVAVPPIVNAEGMTDGEAGVI